jgi:PEP-CTERM motif
VPLLNQQLKSLLLLTLMGLTAAGVSRADIFYSAPPNQSGGSDLNGFLEADDVTFVVPVVLNGLKFWSLQGTAGDYAGSIAWFINANAAPGVPGASLFSGSATPVGVPTGNSAFGFSEFSYSFPIAASLGAGTYWVVLHNGPVNTLPATDFFWEWSNGNSGNSQFQDLSVPNTPWLSNFAETALQVDGVPELDGVPEPSSMLLLGTGVLALGFARGRRK